MKFTTDFIVPDVISFSLLFHAGLSRVTRCHPILVVSCLCGDVVSAAAAAAAVSVCMCVCASACVFLAELRVVTAVSVGSRTG